MDRHAHSVLFLLSLGVLFGLGYAALKLYFARQNTDSHDLLHFAEQLRRSPGRMPDEPPPPPGFALHLTLVVAVGLSALLVFAINGLILAAKMQCHGPLSRKDVSDVVMMLVFAFVIGYFLWGAVPLPEKSKD